MMMDTTVRDALRDLTVEQVINFLQKLVIFIGLGILAYLVIVGSLAVGAYFLLEWLENRRKK